ncbi:Uncharacterized protein APZ42_003539, partial [Daphnia magna]
YNFLSAKKPKAFSVFLGFSGNLLRKIKIARNFLRKIAFPSPSKRKKIHLCHFTVKKVHHYFEVIFPKYSADEIWGSHPRKLCILSQYEIFGV